MTTDLTPLFHPDSIAIVGASADGQKSGGRFLNSLRQAEYQGTVYAVNNNVDAIPGEKVYRRVSDIPGEVDLAILAIPARATLASITDCAEKGVKFAIIHGAGFAELGEEGLIYQQQVVSVAQAAGLRLVGPNCMGITCPESRINTVVDNALLSFVPGGVSFIGQSGWGTEYTLAGGSSRGVRFRAAVSSGNQCDLTIADYLAYFGNDPKTKVIGAYIEGFKDGRRFLAAARQAAVQKPVVVWKAGRTPTGARSVKSHTGSLAGNDAISRAALRQAGVEDAFGYEEMMDALVAFSSPILPKGPRVGILVETGGGAASGSDACESFGLQVPELPATVQDGIREYLREFLPPFAGIGNPVDVVWAPAGPAAAIQRRCIEFMAPSVDAFLVMAYEPHDDQAFMKGLVAARDSIGKPIFVVPPYAVLERARATLCTENGLPAFDSMERAAKALARLVRWVQKA